MYATQAVLLAKVGKRTGDNPVASRVAYPGTILKTIDMAVARTGTAILELGKGLLCACLELASTMQRKVGGLEVLEQEAWIGSGW